MPDLTVQQAAMAWLYSLDAADLAVLTAAIKNGKNISDAASGGGGGAPTTDAAFTGATFDVTLAGPGATFDLSSGGDFTVHANDDVMMEARSQNVRFYMQDVGGEAVAELRADSNIDVHSDNGDISIYSDGFGTHFVDIHANGVNASVRIQSNATGKLGFFNVTPVNKPTGVAVTAAAIHAALVSLGLIGA